MTDELTVAAWVAEMIGRAAGPGAEAEVVVHHAAQALTRFANSAIHQNVADATTTVRLRLHLDGRTASGSTTVLTDTGLTSLVERTIAAARLSPPDAGWAGLVAPAPQADTEAAFDEATARATPEERAARVRDFVQAAGGLETAGFCRTVYSSAAFANTAGHTVTGRAVEAALDGIARSGGADGVARLAGVRLADLDGAALGRRAAAKARAGRDPIELPPGRYEVILEPEAVADLLNNLTAFGFNGRDVAQGQSFVEVGASQFDPAITFLDDPVGAALPFDDEGTARAAVTLINRGITAGVTHDRTSAAQAGATSTGHASPASRSWGPVATHPSLLPAPAAALAATPTAAIPATAATGTAVPGTAATGTAVPATTAATADGEGDGPIAPTARPLVAGLRRGLLVTDLWYTRVLDKKSLAITGLTRNGVWLIENGEVVAPVSNMRFTQSYRQALAPGAVLAVGPQAVRLPDRWAGHQYAAPALHLSTWNLTGNASG